MCYVLGEASRRREVIYLVLRFVHQAASNAQPFDLTNYDEPAVELFPRNNGTALVPRSRIYPNQISAQTSAMYATLQRSAGQRNSFGAQAQEREFLMWTCRAVVTIYDDLSDDILTTLARVQAASRIPQDVIEKWLAACILGPFTMSQGVSVVICSVQAHVISSIVVGSCPRPFIIPASIGRCTAEASSLWSSLAAHVRTQTWFRHMARLELELSYQVLGQKSRFSKERTNLVLNLAILERLSAQRRCSVRALRTRTLYMLKFRREHNSLGIPPPQYCGHACGRFSHPAGGAMIYRNHSHRNSDDQKRHRLKWDASVVVGYYVKA
ncbi:hypothetical protein K438DRAFT_1785386 [Mycena galopus ATCC 62051]|nr:hypothetical protein K438DRAFT_1785386 [Mycena galopus ATCC 62051]